MAYKFITFEGGEGSGKSTQARLLAERLRVLGHEIVLTREPGGSPLAEKIRALILQQKPESSDAEFLLFAAARAEHIATTIEPALTRGAFVICDRYVHSTRVYQGTLGGIDVRLIQEVERATVAPFFPTLTVLLDVPAEIGVERVKKRGETNHYDWKDLGWHSDLRQAFLKEAAADPGRCSVIDADRGEAAIAADIWAKVVGAFNLGVS